MIRLLILFALFGATSACAAEAVAPIRLGIAPHTSARALIGMYQPVRAFLEDEEGVPVQVVTATDFTEFAAVAFSVFSVFSALLPQ